MNQIVRPLFLAVAFACVGSAEMLAQASAALVDKSVRVREPLGDPRPWIADAERRLAEDSTDVDALRLGSLALVTLGKAVVPSQKSAFRDSAFARAERWALRAAALQPESADVQFAVAMALGNAALAKAPQERVQTAEEIYRAAKQAVTLDPAHDGAWHVLGRWHAEMLRVSAFERFFAKQLLGAEIFDRATWPEAISALERARTIDGTRLHHRLELAQVYADRKRWADARAELDALAALPNAEANDTLYRRLADQLQKKLRGRR